MSFTITNLETILTSLKYSIHYMENKPVPDYYPTFEYRQARIQPLIDASHAVHLAIEELNSAKK